MEVAAFVVCMAIIAQINAAPAPQSRTTISHHNNEFDLPPMARKGFEMNIVASVYVNDSTTDKLKLILLPQALEEDPNSVPENCKLNLKGKHICVVPNQALMTRSGESQSISIHRISIIAEFDDADTSTLSLSVLLNGSHQGLYFIPLQDFDANKHFSLGGIIDILKLEFEFKH